MRLNLENNLETSMSIYTYLDKKIYVINFRYLAYNLQCFSIFFFVLLLGFYCFVKSLIKFSEIAHVV